MSDVRIPVTSSEYIRVPVFATKSGVPYNPTADVVQFAFITSVSAHPQLTDWQPAQWETTPAGYYAICLINGSGVTLTAATYYVWIRITDNPEVPVRQVGTLTLE